MNNELSLIGARICRPYGTIHRLKTYDDGFGDCYLYWDSYGPCAIVRAMSWEDAYECVLDAILEPIPDDEVPDAFDGDNLIEGYMFQANATGSGIVELDLNCEALEPVTADTLSRHGITLEVIQD